MSNLSIFLLKTRFTFISFEIQLIFVFIVRLPKRSRWLFVKKFFQFSIKSYSDVWLQINLETNTSRTSFFHTLYGRLFEI